MKITVTQAHIDAGRKSDCYKCPIALALRDRFPEDTFSVSPVRIILVQPSDDPTVFPSPRVCSWVPPTSAVKFLRKFDGGLPVKPFAFLLPKTCTLAGLARHVCVL